MHRHPVLRRVSLWGAAAITSMLTLLPASAQTPAEPPPGRSELTAAPTCTVSLDQLRFDRPLRRVARLIADRKPVRIVALGSSSTFGAGGSTSAASYPSRLAEELSRHFPGHDITVLNRGVNGDEASDMLARLDTAVIAEKPDLVLWQVGTNSVLRDKAVLPHATLLHEGLMRMKATGADIVLIDPQYAPKVIAKPHAEGMVSLIATAAKSEQVCLFHRFALMQSWYEKDRLPFEAFVSADGLHMNDWSYGCLAKGLGVAIAEAATRPTATAAAPLGMR
ncbi:MAG: SGNH/GDSL hydrolase family protein [Hyphomicrobiales bacterium]|nr:SGNH/GDSL hydrolase family protein [Hyphomicrobiales bacterium]